MAGKTALVTGGTGGIGRATAAGLAALSARVGITGPDKARTQAAATGIVRESGNPAVDAFAAGMSCQAGVRALAVAVPSAYPRLDVLASNVGGFWATRHLTAGGPERTFAVNHLAAFLLTGLVLDRFKGSAPARIVTVLVQRPGGGQTQLRRPAGRTQLLRAAGVQPVQARQRRVHLRTRPPLFDLVTPMPYVELQKLPDEASARGIHGYQKGTYVEELSGPVIDGITDFSGDRVRHSYVPAKYERLARIKAQYDPATCSTSTPTSAPPDADPAPPSRPGNPPDPDAGIGGFQAPTR